MNSFVPSPGFDVSRLKGTTLILPSVSIGNVPQLSTDLFLSTVNLDRVGCLEDENVVPVLGPADRPHPASGSGNTQEHQQHQQQLSLAIEVFQSKDGQWTIVQQRSPTVRHRSHFFADNLVKFIQDSGFTQVLLLASADGARRIDVQLRSGTPVRYIGSPALSSSLVEKIQGLGLQPLESVPPTEEEKRNAEIHMKQQHQLRAAALAAATSGLADRVQGIQLEGDQDQGQQVLEKVPRIPNGGIARRLHSLCQEQGVAILTLVLFAMEGDNAPDAIFLANVANAIFSVHVPTQRQILEGEGWKFPKSWDSLYGNTHHEDMY